ncbi:hypothetical protein [Flagellimonas sp.]|uniref:hypothetical protein n=1 Tax=Flagellimonas sp. TaxID=2058762 RepID=UPI003AB6FAB4
MKENKLIASVVVFKELLDNDKDIYDVISEFLKAVIIDKQIWNFNSTELKLLLEEVFDFKLPEAVIRSTLKNRLIRSQFLKVDNGTYIVNNIQNTIDPDFEKKYLEKKKLYQEIENEFIGFIEKNKKVSFNKSERELVQENINQYLLGNFTGEKYTQDISEYIIKKKDDKEFANRLNVVKEGVVLYSGIRYTADLNELGKWTKPLTIFLDTEILFNYEGYNGTVYKEIFLDFLKLVREINQSNKKEKLIELRYFSETQIEIEKFFHVATLIIENKVSLDPSKTAMKEIINGCRSKSDILVKKTKFFHFLQTNGIYIEDDKDYYTNKAFNVEDISILDELQKLSKLSGREFNEEYCKNNLKLFTKVNVLRKGQNGNGFENCRYILLTGNHYIHYLAHQPKIKENEKDVPFATDIDFITDKFWFKLKKGFGHSGDTPKSFDMISKAQIVLSSQISNTVQEKYTVLTEKFANGELTKDEAISITYELRESILKPEEITAVNVSDKLTFIENFTIEQHLREREMLQRKISEGEHAKQELKHRDRLNRTKKHKSIKIWYRFLIKMSRIAFIVFAIGFSWFVFWILRVKIFSEENTNLSIISLIISIASLIPFWKLFQYYDRHISDLIRLKFKDRLVNSFARVR